MSKHAAIYVRVSSKAQDTKSQEPELKHFAESLPEPPVWYSDSATGKNMDRPGWKKLEAAIRSRKVDQVVVWRLDRLGRSASDLTALFEEWQGRGINLISLKEGLDLSTAAGRLMANVLASVAQFETELRGDRVRAGQSAARAQGKRWGGSQKGSRKKVTKAQVKLIHSMKSDGEPVTTIAKSLNLSRPTIYDVLNATTAATPAV